MLQATWLPSSETDVTDYSSWLTVYSNPKTNFQITSLCPSGISFRAILLKIIPLQICRTTKKSVKPGDGGVKGWGRWQQRTIRVSLFLLLFLLSFFLSSSSSVFFKHIFGRANANARLPEREGSSLQDNSYACKALRSQSLYDYVHVCRHSLCPERLGRG